MYFYRYFPEKFVIWLKKNLNNAGDITLIRNKNLYITENGRNIETPLFVSSELLENIINKICDGSLYSQQKTLKDGYITLPEGHRVGFTGTCVENLGNIEYMRDFTAINIRIAKEITGAANEIIPEIENYDRIYNTLIISPPSAGKTTMLRDLARQLGNRYRTGIVDERGEIAGNNNLGRYSFVIDGCNKSSGIIMLLRSMSPQIVITDEIGGEKDEQALISLLNAGIKIICTVHGYGKNDILRRPSFKKLISEGVFEKLVTLSIRNGPGTIEEITTTFKEVANV